MKTKKNNQANSRSSEKVGFVSFVAGGQVGTGMGERVPHLWKDVHITMRMAEVVRDTSDGDGFFYPSHPSM